MPIAQSLIGADWQIQIDKFQAGAPLQRAQSPLEFAAQRRRQPQADELRLQREHADTQIQQLVDMLDASNAELNALTKQTSTERQVFEQETGQLTMEVASLRRQLSGGRQRDLETHSKSFREQQASWEVVLCVY